MVVAELVKEDVEQLVGAERSFREPQQVSFRGGFDGNIEAGKEGGVLSDVLGVRYELAKVSGLGAYGHESRPVETVAAGACRRQQDGVKSDCQSPPLRQDLEEFSNVTNEQDVTVT